MKPTMPERDSDVVSHEGLLALLRNENKKLVVLDCRSSIEYADGHIRGAVNFSIPSIMLRRLAAGKIDLAATIKCRELKQKVCSAYTENLFVLYNDLAAVQQQHQPDSVLNVLLRRLTQDGCRVVCLKDGFRIFRDTFPEWCASCLELMDSTGGQPPAAGSDPLPLMGLRSLRISAPPLNRQPHHSCDSLSSTANSSTDSSDTDDRCDSSLGIDFDNIQSAPEPSGAHSIRLQLIRTKAEFMQPHFSFNLRNSLGLEDDREFPVEILPYLFLGNAANSEDIKSLEKHGIKYILNVTPDLPNVFEDSDNFKYMQIPITDHWSQNLARHFPQAINFIEEAHSNENGVLVHCLAGISRSVTITVAYLMYKHSLNLNDAFNVVRARKSNIAPNFHFMEQLHNFERELKLDVASQPPGALLERMRARDAARHGSHRDAKRARPRCRACGLATDCKCGQHMDFLSPLAQAGVSPDSGIEFDRWTTSMATSAE